MSAASQRWTVARLGTAQTLAWASSYYLPAMLAAPMAHDLGAVSYTHLDVYKRQGSITAGFTAHGVADYTRRESRITAELPSAEVAAQLRQPTSRPVLQVESLNVDLACPPIEWARAWFAGDRVKLTIDHDEHT